MLDTISTAKMSHEEWLEERRKSIGGSDAAAVIGMSRFASPYTVWMDKTGRLPEKEDTEAMRIGRDLEEYVAKRFEEASGKKVRRACLHARVYCPRCCVCACSAGNAPTHDHHPSIYTDVTHQRWLSSSPVQY